MVLKNESELTKIYRCIFNGLESSELMNVWNIGQEEGDQILATNVTNKFWGVTYLWSIPC